MSYTKQDLDLLFNYNKTQKFVYFSPKGRLQWYLMNMHKDYLNENLSCGLKTQQDFDQLKKQVKAELSAGRNL